MGGMLEGKVGVVVGVANKRSIAWGIAQAWAEAGATVVMSYQGDRLREKVEELASELSGRCSLVLPCDVGDDEQLAALARQTGEQYPRVDCLLHSVAYAPKEALEDRFVNASRQAFGIAHDISSYSLVGLTRAFLPYMTNGGSVTTMSFYGAVKAVPNYNIMGVAKASLEATVRYLAADVGQEKIRVNAISAGPMQTLAARGISHFNDMYKYHERHAPLGRSSTLEELGAAAVFLASEGAAAITGQVIYVDGGYQIVAM